MDKQLQHRPRSRDLQRRPKAAIHGRRRPKAAIGRALATGTAWAGLCLIHHHQRQRSANVRGRRRPKAGVGACRASSLARTRAEAPTQVRKGPFDPPLCVSPLDVCPSDAMLLPSSAIRHAMAPLRPAQVPCRLNDYNRKRLLSPTSVQYFWTQEQQPFPGASRRRSLPGNAHPATLSPSTSTSLSRPL